MIAESIFWLALALTAYAYVGYPIIAWWMARRARGTYRSHVGVDPTDLSEWPMVSLVIAAYKEESVILERLQNAIMLDYPADRIEVLIGVDGNEDLTGDLVTTFGDPRVRLLQYPERRGKASVLNDSVPQARGEIIVFSDANTNMDRDSIKRLVRHFRDAEVGAVCGKLVLFDPVRGQNVDGMYWKYENFLKSCEAQFGALLGVNGAVYAIRKELYRPIPSDTIIDDFLIGMRIHLAGKRLLYDDQAIAYEETPAMIGDEFHRRARIGAGGFQSLFWLLPLLNPLRGRLAFAFWSHKVLRWFCPTFLIAALASNIYLSRDPFYVRVLLLQELFYLAAVVGMAFKLAGGGKKVLRIPAMFVSMNAALFVGLWRWLTHTQSGAWKRTERVDVTTHTDNTEHIGSGEPATPGAQAKGHAPADNGDATELLEEVNHI